MSEHQVIEIKSLIESSFEKLKDLNISINDYLDDLRNKYNDKDEKIENETDKPNKISLLANINKHEMCHVGHALQIHPKWKKSKCNQCGDITKYLCWNCHHYDGRYDPPNHDKTSSKYYCCKDCGVKNAKKIKKRIINTTNKQNDIIKYYSNNPEIGFDMLCGLKNRLAFEYLLNEIVASNVDELSERIDKLVYEIENQKEKIIVDEQNYFTLGIKQENGEKINIGFVFPGQSSQDINMSRILYEKYQWARNLVDKLATQEMKELMFPDYFDQINSRNDGSISMLRDNLSETRLTQPCIVLSSLLWAKHLEHLGIKPMIVAGHSLGELNALHYANAVDDKTVIELAKIRGYSMSKYASKPGSMIHLPCSKMEAQEMINKLSILQEISLNIANINSLNNTILSGDIESIDKMNEYAKECGIYANKIAVSGAFHSDLMEPASKEFLRQINELNLTMPSQSYSIPIISSKTGLILDSNTDLSSHLCSCLTSPVEWISAVNSMTGVLTSNSMVIEVGPKKVLNNLISSIKHGNIDQNSNVKYVNSVEGKIGSFTDLNWSIATLFANGFDVDLSYLHKNRIIQSWIPPSQKSFIVNPCERLMFPENGFEYSAINCFADGDQQNKINLNNINPCCSHLFPATASTEIAKTHVFSSTTNCKATSKSTSKAKTKPKSKSKAKPISKTKSKKKSHRKTKSPIQTQLPLRRSVRLRNKRETAMTPY
eukprot:440406_1